MTTLTDDEIDRKQADEAPAITVAKLAAASDRKMLGILRALNVFGGNVTINQPLDLALIGAALSNAGCNLDDAQAKQAAQPIEREASKHVCGLQGYNGMVDPPCPGCEARAALASHKDGDGVPGTPETSDGDVTGEGANG